MSNAALGGAPGQDISRGDVSCKNAFFPGGWGVSGAPFGGGRFGGEGGASLSCPKSGPELA